MYSFAAPALVSRHSPLSLPASAMLPTRHARPYPTPAIPPPSPE